MTGTSLPIDSVLRPLRVERRAGGPWDDAVGAVAFDAIGLPRLAGAAGDAWLAGAPRRRVLNGLQLAEAGGWAFGAIDVPADGQGLTAQAREAYGRLFAALQALGQPPLMRLWNYLPRINDASDGLERYRQFNRGRQEAFVAAGVDAFAGAPAACALGKGEGTLSIRFLAGRTRVWPLENPRQVPAWRYSTRFGPKAPTFSRAVLADAGGARTGLWISGTASIVGEDSVHEGDVRAQTRETIVNLQAMLAVAQDRLATPLALDDLALTVYLRHPGDRAAIGEVLAAAAPRAASGAIWLQADICRSELLVEIEAHGLFDGGLS